MFIMAMCFAVTGLFLMSTLFIDRGPVLLPLVNIAILLLLSTQLMQDCNICFNLQASSMLLQLCFFYFFQDITFYYTHVFMHQSMMYKHIHYIHHQFRTNSWRSFLYMHPVELITCVFFPLFGSVFILQILDIPVNATSLIVWINLAALNSMWTHGDSTMLGKSILRRHSLHHQYHTCNFGSNMMDNFHGTNR